MNVCMFVTTYIYLQPNIVSNSVLLAAKGNYKSFHPHFVFFFIAACSLSFNIFNIHHIDLHLRPGFNHHYQKCIPYFPPPSTPTFAIFFFSRDREPSVSTFFFFFVLVLTPFVRGVHTNRYSQFSTCI